MGKKYLINESTLIDIAEAIRRKTFSAAAIDPTLFATLISTIQGGDASASISADDGLLEILLGGVYDGDTVNIATLPSSQLGWFGTAVPENSLITKVYVNTQLSVTEIVDIFQELNFIENPEANGIGLLSACVTDTNMTNAIYVYFNSDIKEYFINYRINGEDTIIWTQKDGWLPSFTGEITINCNNNLDNLLDSYGLSLDHNSKWVALFSTTPFIKDSIGVIDLQDYINNRKIPLSFNIPVWNNEFEGGAEVYTWTKPIQHKDELIIEQIFEATLQGTTLEVK